MATNQASTIIAFMLVDLAVAHAGNDLSGNDQVQFGKFDEPPTHDRAFVTIGGQIDIETADGPDDTRMGEFQETMSVEIEGWAPVTADTKAGVVVSGLNLAFDIKDALEKSHRVSGGNLFDLLKTLVVTDISIENMGARGNAGRMSHFLMTCVVTYDVVRGL